MPQVIARAKEILTMLGRANAKDSAVKRHFNFKTARRVLSRRLWSIANPMIDVARAMAKA